MNCTYHIGNPITLICIAPHKCQSQRKLCVECLDDHGVDWKHIISIRKFQEMAIKKLKDSKLDETSELTKQRMTFKSTFSQTQNAIKKIFEELSQSINQIFELIERKNQSFFNLIDQNTNLAECSNTDLETLVQILGGNILNNRLVLRNTYLINLENLNNWWGQEIKAFSEKVREKSKELLQKNLDSNQFYSIQPLKPYQLNEYTKQLIGFFWDYSYNQPLQLKLRLQITFTQNKEIQYTKDGFKIRIDQIKETTRKPEILTNLEQIQHLHWSGNYGKNNQKIGKWIATWKGETIQGVGGKYSDDGQKQGKWREIIKNYWSLGKVFEEGEYVKDQRSAVWKYIYENNEIGGGGYNTEGLKNGKWIDLSEGFWQYSQLTQNGEYKNGKKVGRWDIFYRKQSSDSFTQIGGGSYDEAGTEIKMGNWVEKSDNFTDSSQVTYNGEYQYGNKVGRWDIQCRKEIDQPFKTIGGGLYNIKGDGLKLGNWVEISDNFRDSSQVIYKGEYKNGKKVGRWDIVLRKNFDEPFKKIGGGSYDEAGTEIKIGNWVEKSDNFTDSSQVTYNGEYQNGNKVGRWDIQCRKEIDQPFKTIGGGSYNIKGDGLKLGNWVEISDNFRDSSQVIYKGEYKNGQKVGRWNIEYRKDFDDKFQYIGGGLYIEGSYTANVFYEKQIPNNEIKNKIILGKDDSEYWDFLNEPLSKIGDESCHEVNGGVKFGKWIELHDGFMNSSQVTYHGEYLNGRKVNRWDIFLNKNGKQQQIGGGLYVYKEVENSGLVKLGNWIELDDGFNDFCQITYQGEYSNNKKVGRWDSYFQGIQIGGGSYNENGVKYGKWTLLSDNFFMYNLVTYIGSFQDGEKVGQWDIMKIQIQDENLIFEKIGQKSY